MLKISSNPQNLESVESFVEKIFERHQLSKAIYGNILISLTEAVTNAIKHGNDNDESKCVCLKCNLSQSQIAFEVTDEGPGFDFDNIPDPTAPENLLQIGGRGVFLMRQLSDDVTFSNNGNTVEICFNL